MTERPTNDTPDGGPDEPAVDATPSTTEVTPPLDPALNDPTLPIVPGTTVGSTTAG